MVGTIVHSPEVWSAFAEFCEVVVQRKEEDERARKRGLDPPEGALVSPPNPHSSDEEP